jgi:hypothetical protein
MESILHPAIRWIFIARIREMAGVEGDACIFPGAPAYELPSNRSTAYHIVKQGRVVHRSKNGSPMSQMGHERKVST